MAGSDPLADLFTGDRGLNPDAYPQVARSALRRQQRRMYRDKELSSLLEILRTGQARQAQEANAAQNVADWESGFQPTPDAGMGALRQAESGMAAETTIIPPEEYAAHLEALRKTYEEQVAQFTKVRDESLALYKSDPGRYAHLFSDERTNALKGWQQNLDQMAKALAAGEDQLAKARAEESAGVEDTGFLSTVGTLLENSPLAGLSETIGGLASYPAEALGALLGGASARNSDFSDTSLSGAALNLNPIGLIANAVGVGTSGSELRTRGREFFTQGGRSLTAGGLNVRNLAGSLPDLAAWTTNNEREYAEILRDGTVDDFLNTFALQAATDPLNLMPAGAGTALVKTAWAPIAARFPNLAKYPEKFVLKLLGKHKAADVLHNPKMEKLLELQSGVEGEAGYEYLKFIQDVRAAKVELLKPLNDVQRQQFDSLLPGMVEQTDKAKRLLARETLHKDDVVQAALLDAADQYDDFAGRAFALDKKYGSKIAELGGEFNYFGRRFSDELHDWLAKNPGAQEIIFGAHMGNSRKAMDTAFANWEQHRKLGEFDFYDAEQTVRTMLEKSHGLPRDIPIWSRDAFGDLAARGQKAADKAAHRHLILNAAEALGVKDPLLAQAAEMMVKIAADDAEAAAWVRLEQAAIKAEVAQMAASAYKVGQKEVKASLSAQATEARKIPQAANELADVVRGQREVKASLKAERDLRKMFPDAPDIADDAEAAMRNMAESVGTRLEANPSAKKVVQQFYDDYQKAADIDGYRAAVRTFKDRLRAIVSPDIAKDYAKLADDALRQLERLERAQFAVSKPVTLAVSQRARDAAKEVDRLEQAAVTADINQWSPEIKVRYVQHLLRKVGIVPPPRHTSALDVALKANAELPDDVADIARLATSYIDPKSAEDFTKYATNWYWKDQTPGKFFQWYDGLKAIYQRSTLARPTSLAKDMLGTGIQSWFARDFDQIGKALKDLGGTTGKWKQGVGVGYQAADDVLRLQAEGVLHTTVGESLRKGAFEGVPVLGRIEERGVLGAMLPSKASTAATKVTDTLLETRTFFEQAHRLATYRRAINEGMSHADAVEEVYKYWGKFNELSKLERNVLNRIMFFAMWRLRSMPIAMRMVLDHPVRSKMLMTMMAGNVRDDETQPEWLRRMGGWRIGVDENGNARTINIGGNSYGSPLASLLESNLVHGLRKGEIAETPGLLLRETLRGAPPFVTAPFEAGFGIETFSGKPHYDEQGIQQTQASPMFYWFTTEDSTGAVERLLNLQVQRDAKTGQIRRVTMDPKWATLFGGLPGVDPLLTDVGNFVDPRDVSSPYSLSERSPEITTVRGASRLIGMPVYSVPMTTEEQQNIKELRKALAKDSPKLTGGSLVTSWQSGSQRLVPSRTDRGRKLAADIDRWEAEGKQQGLHPHALRQFVGERLSHFYQDEWKLMELDRELEYAENYAEQREGTQKPRLSVADLETPKAFGAGPLRVKKVLERERR